MVTFLQAEGAGLLKLLWAQREQQAKLIHLLSSKYSRLEREQSRDAGEQNDGRSVPIKYTQRLDYTPDAILLRMLSVL